MKYLHISFRKYSVFQLNFMVACMKTFHTLETISMVIVAFSQYPGKEQIRQSVLVCVNKWKHAWNLLGCPLSILEKLMMDGKMTFGGQIDVV